MSNFDEKFNMDDLRQIKEGISLFNLQKYWECHEELEGHWLEAKGRGVRYVFWAVIQVAASMYHYRDKNFAGTYGMFKKAKEKFLEVEKRGVESDLMEKYLSWGKLKKIMWGIPENPIINDFEILYTFRFEPDPTNWNLK